MQVSVLILTFNEAACIDVCIASVEKWSDDIVVLDAFSTDETVVRALDHVGVRVFQHVFKDYASQRNHGLKALTFKHDWVLLLDADEAATQALKDEILTALPGAPETLTSMTLRRKDYFNQKWVPAFWNVRFERLVRPSAVSFVGAVHEKLSSTLNQGELQGHVDHYPFQKGFETWLSRRVGYAQVSARQELAELVPLQLRQFLSRKQPDRQRALKGIFQRLPGRYPAYFVYLFWLRGGYLAGVDGLHFCVLETFSQYFVHVYKEELSRSE